MEERVECALQKVKESLSQQPQVLRYHDLDKQIMERDDLADLNDAILHAQKELTLLEYFAKEQAAMEKNEEWQKLKQELSASDLFYEYQDAVYEVNELMQYITKRIENEINKG